MPIHIPTTGGIYLDGCEVYTVRYALERAGLAKRTFDADHLVKYIEDLATRVAKQEKALSALAEDLYTITTKTVVVG